MRSAKSSFFGTASLRAAYRELDGLGAGERAVVSIADPNQAYQARQLVLNRLADRVRDALTTTGLTPEEAGAMVETWRPDWLGDRGLRVLYLLPQEWTEATLPLKLEPAPRMTVRVMVGRSEVLEPDVEQALDLALAEQLQHGKASQIQRLQALLEPRFHEPAITGAINREVDRASAKALPKAELALQRNKIYQAGQSLRQLLRKPRRKHPPKSKLPPCQ
ncbi:MAG: hypothetical protein HC834_03785 [Rhodospirillales bacterium]|nr:hypothetical protein [Rhodospirillales bacterium]